MWRFHGVTSGGVALFGGGVMRTGTVISLGASAVLGVGALIVARVWLPQPNAHGQQQGKAAAEFFTETKTIYFEAI